MAATFTIGTREVGGDAPVFIIAELSANHGHRLEVALETIDAAKRAGADAIKIQTYTPDTLTLPFERDPFIVRTSNAWAGKTLHALYADAMTPWEWTSALKRRAEEHGLVFFSTPFDTSAVDFLEGHGVPLYKIASFEIVDLPLVEYVAQKQKPMIMSTGMCTFEEIARAVSAVRAAGNDRIALLRCVSSYPAKAEEMNLAALEQLRTLGTVVGLSDHTREHEVAVTAVALGARVIEKHFITARALGGPDAFFSLEPAEFAEMVRQVRAAEKAIGRARFGPTPSEQASLAFRRSLFVTREVKKGERFTCDNVRSVRPGNGLPARLLPQVLGCVATIDLSAGTPLGATDVGERPKVEAAGDALAISVRAGVADVTLTEPTEALVAAALAQAKDAVILRVTAKGGAEVLRRAGFYHFRSEGERTVCERRLRDY
jgi:pseudaminic acid synthase